MNPLPQLIAPRLARTLQRVQARIWASTTTLPVLAGPVLSTSANLAEAARQRMTPLVPGSFIAPSGSWHHRWLRIDLPAASRADQGRRHLSLRCHGEATVWIDGEAWCGLDVAHRTGPVPDRACTLWIEWGLWQTGIWYGTDHPGEHGLRFDGAELLVRDELAWSVSHDLDALKQVLDRQLATDRIAPPLTFGYHPEQPDVHPFTRRLLGALDEALDAFQADDLAVLQRALARVYRDFPAESWQPAAELVGHGHLDLVWLWPEGVTERKAIHTCATMLRLMDRYPEFIYLQSQPAFYRAVERLAPGLMTRIRARIAEGRWEVLGGFEVEPDNQLPCGEALARSLIIGQGKITDLQGKPSRVCWLPDVFGYSACLPQLLRLAGLDRFYSTKMTWSAVNRFPYTSFTWRGNDGSEVLTHLCPTGYNGEATLTQMADALRSHRDLAVHPATLLPTGFGDGAGGTTEAQIERARRFRNLAGSPRTSWSTAEGFMNRLAKVQARLPTYQGELYLEYHRGTYTTQARFKAVHRALERALQRQEAVHAALGLGPVDETPWRRLAFTHFHDAIPGSSIGLVYDQLGPELAGYAAAADRTASTALAGRGRGLTVFNPLPVAVERVVELPGAHAGLTWDGRPLATQVVGDRTLATLRLDPLAAVHLVPGPAVTAPHLTASATRLASDRVEAAFDAHGLLTALTIDGHDIPLTGPAGLRLYEDQPAHFDAWDIDHHVLRRFTPVPGGRLHVVDHGPLRAVLSGDITLPEGAGTATIRYTLEAGSPWLGVHLAIDWTARHRLLKWHLPTAHRGLHSRYGSPFGSLLRPQAPGTPKEEAQWEVCGQRWAAVLGDDLEGAAVVTACSYGFSCREGDLGLSLLRAPTDPDPEADQGHHDIAFAVGRHRRLADHQGPSTAGAADTLFTPPVVVSGANPRPSPFRFEDAGSLVPSWVVPGDDHLVIRAHETDGRAGEALLLLDRPARLRLIDLRGKPIGKARRIDAHTWGIPYTAYQVVSVEVRHIG